MRFRSLGYFSVIYYLSAHWMACSSDVNTSQYLNHHDSVAYVGMNTCRSCHTDKYNTYVHTGMGQSFDLARPQKSAAKFDDIQPVYDSFANLYYFPFWIADTLYFKEFRLDGKDTSHLLVQRIDYIIGSGQHTNSHLYQVNGYLYQAPLTWYTQKQQWGLPPGFENGNNSRFWRKLDDECMSCHNGLPEFEEHSGNLFTHIPNGIDCERCHGPGEAHIAKISRGELTDTSKDIDYSIVHPGKLPWQRQMDLCQRCHLQGNAVLKPNKQFSDFKPGMKLSEFFNVYLPQYEDGNQFIMASHVERLNESKCFIESNKKGSSNNLTCITCHNPHISVKRTPRNHFNTVCKSCHTGEHKSLVDVSVPMSNCVSCHMKNSGTTDIPHVQIHDHKIGIPDSSKPRKGKLVGLKVLNNNNPSEEEMLQGYISYFEKFERNPFYLKQAKALLGAGNWETQIHYYYNVKNYQEIINQSKKWSPTDCSNTWTMYRIASAYSKKMDYKNADVWGSALVKKAPKNIDFLNLGVEIKLLNKQFASAKPLLDKLLNANPMEESTLINAVKYELAKGQTQRAITYLNKLLAIHPDSQEGNRLNQLVRSSLILETN